MNARDWARDFALTWTREARDWRGLACAWLACAWLAAVLIGVIAAAGHAQTAHKEKPGQDGQNDPAAASEAQKKKKLSPAEAQAAVDAAAKLLEAGKADTAVRSLTGTLAEGHLPPAVMAKALYYRGIAYRQEKKPAQAIADLTSALWLKGGLTEGERAVALKQRAAAYGEAGLTDTGSAIAAVPQGTRAAAGGEGGAAKGAGAAGPEASAGGWNFFGNIFGASASAPTPSPAPVAPPAPAGEWTAKSSEAKELGAPDPGPAKPTGGWTHNTEVHGGTAAIETATLPVKAEGRFCIQLGMARTHDQAEAMVVKIKSQYGDAVGRREPEIDEAVVGNMGSFYRVRVGPFASPQEGQAACSRLKGSGLDCLVVAQ